MAETLTPPNVISEAAIQTARGRRIKVGRRGITEFRNRSRKETAELEEHARSTYGRAVPEDWESKKYDLTPGSDQVRLPIPCSTKEPFLYAIRLQGQKGFWPAEPSEQILELADPRKPRTVPAFRTASLEANAAAPLNPWLDKDTGEPRLRRVREWRILGRNRSGEPCYEDPAICLGRSVCRVVEVQFWCPIRGADRDTGIPSDHGLYRGEVPDDPLRTGACPECASLCSDGQGQLDKHKYRAQMELRRNAIERLRG